MDTEGVKANLISLTHQNPCFSASAIITNLLNKYGDDPAAFQDQNRIKSAPTSLHEYRVMFDENLRLTFIEAEVRSDSLDTGSDPIEKAISAAERFGAKCDIPAQFISKKLGGDGHRRNVYPAKFNVDLSQSENDQNRVYLFVKDRQDRSAKLYFGLIFDEPDENDVDVVESGKYFFRPLEIFYIFVLFENDKIAAVALEGKIDNKLPKFY